MGRKRSDPSNPNDALNKRITSRGGHVIVTKPEKDFSFIIHECFGELSNDGRWVKELRVLEWGNNLPKFDIRAWDIENPRERCTKGITLSKEELIALKAVLEVLDLDNYEMPDKKREIPNE